MYVGGLYDFRHFFGTGLCVCPPNWPLFMVIG